MGRGHGAAWGGGGGAAAQHSGSRVAITPDLEPSRCAINQQRNTLKAQQSRQVRLSLHLTCPPQPEQITARLSATCYRKNRPSSIYLAHLCGHLSPSKCLQSGGASGRKMSHKRLFAFQTLSPPPWRNHAIRPREGGRRGSECKTRQHKPSKGQFYCVK